MAGLLVVAQLAALALAPVFVLNTQPVFENPEDPLNSLVYILLILAFTGLILLVVRLRRGNIVKYVILGAMFFTMLLVFYLIFFILFAAANSPWADPLAFLEAMVISGALTYALAKYPEWYLVDAVGVSVAAGVTAILGFSFAILPALLLLIGLAVYDAISVYKTKHMVTLADAATSQRLPIMIVIPRKRGYSFLRQKSIKQQIASGEEREAMFMGLGDVIIPGVLVVSSFVYLDRSVLVFGIVGNLIVALMTLAGTVVGFAILMRFVMKGNPQAGLPLLNSGAILGYFSSYLVVFGDLSFGIG
ncbi:MAG TPA: presenilin family intramembrane aspartyl protease PSH [Thermoplasmata archaeon]|nr:presenilin family intramembrane aspartyl protease PSH [Thermoplasmata archaeon]